MTAAEVIFQAKDNSIIATGHAVVLMISAKRITNAFLA
jgi:hypothetical protein